MANKRDLKKFVRRMCGSIAGECVLACEFVDGADGKTLEGCIVDVADLQEEILSLASVSFDKSERDYESRAAYRRDRRAYFKKAYAALSERFEQGLNAIIKKMNEAMPAVVAEKA